MAANVPDTAPIDGLAFIVGAFYRRRGLHEYFGGQYQQGIWTPRRYPAIFLFTGDRGEQHGYGYDRLQPSGEFHYTGEGQSGDMTFTRMNRAVQNHERDGKRLFLFGQQPARAGEYTLVQFYAEMTCVDSIVHDHDATGTERQTIVFVLIPRQSVTGPSPTAEGTDTIPEPALVSTACSPAVTSTCHSPDC